MDIISRKEAKQKGLARYFTGRPCKSGHICERFASGGCLECRKAREGYNKEWRENNKDKRRVYDKKRYEANKDVVKKRSKAWFKKNPERYYASQRKSIKKHPETERAKNHRHRARKRNAEGRYTPDDIKRIHKMQKGKCAYCAKKLGLKFEVDHIVSLAQGGSNYPNNIQLLCLKTENSCNQSKGRKDPIDFARSLGLLL